MPLTGAERSLLYRQRLKENTDKYRKYLIKENKRYEKKERHRSVETDWIFARVSTEIEKKKLEKTKTSPKNT